MTNLLLVLPVVFLLPILYGSAKIRYYSCLVLTLYISVLSSIPAINILLLSNQSSYQLSVFGIDIIIDKLSAFFILVTNFTMTTGMLFSDGYLQPYIKTKDTTIISIHYINYILLHLSMLLVLVFRNGISFLIAWELMAVSSFILILFEGEKIVTLKTAVNYLIQMHVGFILLLVGILIINSMTGTFSFDGLSKYFADYQNIGLFILFFIGFAIKAGFIPFHTWLPEAHPAAPSHVSGTMSGVMIKMGIYGIIRLLSYVESDLYIIGMIILILSSITGILGVMYAIVQKDIKKLLAFSSIENIGIIGIGIGLGAIGLGINNPTVAVLGFCGAFLHILNHSLFKSLLFFSSGSVYKNYHTRNIEQLGGVIHKMPKTSYMFLIGSIAICGLPPLNGFISELLIYIGLFKGLVSGDFYNTILLIIAILVFVLIGGLAIFCFTKVFGVAFLGVNRSKCDDNVKEVSKSMLFPQIVIASIIISIGLLPTIFITPIIGIIKELFTIEISSSIYSLLELFSKISLINVILISFFVIIYLIRKKVLSKRTIEYSPVWGCGSQNLTVHQQYTGTSYSDNFKDIAKPLMSFKKQYKPIPEMEIFPVTRSYESNFEDVFQKLSFKIVDFVMTVLKNLARLQTGMIQHYILYTFIFILLIFVLMYLNLL